MFFLPLIVMNSIWLVIAFGLIWMGGIAKWDQRVGSNIIRKVKKLSHPSFHFFQGVISGPDGPKSEVMSGQEKILGCRGAI